MLCDVISCHAQCRVVFWSTFFMAVVFLTLGISRSFPLLTRGAVESRMLCGGVYVCLTAEDDDDDDVLLSLL